VKNKISKKNIEIIDLFCGTGGLTCGLKKAGLNVVAGIDNNKTCELAYRNNNKTKFILQDIRKITPKDINEIYSKNAFKILVGCAPCQPFSLLRTKMRDKNVQDEKYNLLLEFGRLIKEVKPDIISMENVPQIKNTIIFEKFLKILNDCGYNEIVYKIVYCPNYGIPQKRKRLVLLSSLHGKINLIEPINVDKMPTVKKFIFNLPSIKAGEQSLLDSLH
jgi:DNA (cytosine-5)-methyltransferase 1